MSNNFASDSIKYVAIDLIGDILYWPLWWYSKGLAKAAEFCFAEISSQQERLGINVWVKNIFTPMFGQYDIEGRIISFFARLIQIIVRSILLFIWSIFILISLLAYVIMPLIIVYQVWDNFLWLWQ